MCAASQSFRFRESRRLEHQAPVSLSLAGERGDVSAVTRDIAEAGMFVCMAGPPPAGSTAAFELDLGTGDAPTMVRGEAAVVWVRDQPGGSDQPAGMGMRFTRLDGDGRERLQAFFDQGPAFATGMNLGATAAPPPESEATTADDEGQAPEASKDSESALSPAGEEERAVEDVARPAGGAASAAAEAPEDEGTLASAATTLGEHELAGRGQSQQDDPLAVPAAPADEEPVAEPDPAADTEPEAVVTSEAGAEPDTIAGSEAAAEPKADAEPGAAADPQRQAGAGGAAIDTDAAAPEESETEADEPAASASAEAADAPTDAGGAPETGNLAMGADLFGDSGADDWMKPDGRPRWVWPTVAGVILVGLLLFFLRGRPGFDGGQAPDQSAEADQPMEMAIGAGAPAPVGPSAEGTAAASPAPSPAAVGDSPATADDAATAADRGDAPAAAAPQEAAEAAAPGPAAAGTDESAAAAEARPVDSRRETAAEPPVSVAAEPSGRPPTRPAPTASPSPVVAPAPANATALRSIRASVEGDRTVVEVVGNAPFVRHAEMTLDGPPRLVLRLVGVRRAFDASSVTGPRLLGVRTGVHGRGATRQLHVVLDLEPGVFTEVERSGDRIVVQITDQP